MEFTRGDVLPTGAVVTDITTAAPDMTDVCASCGRAFATGAPIVLATYADSPELPWAYDATCVGRDAEPTAVTVTLASDGTHTVDAPNWVTVTVNRPTDGATNTEEAPQSGDSATPVFYTLPARDLEEGMSTADGQDVLSVDTLDADGYVFASVYTPRSDDPDLDRANRADSDTRAYLPRRRVLLAVFADTDVDGSAYPHATPA